MITIEEQNERMKASLLGIIPDILARYTALVVNYSKVPEICEAIARHERFLREMEALGFFEEAK